MLVIPATSCLARRSATFLRVELKYKEPPHLDHEAASLILHAALDGGVTVPSATEVLIGLALFDEDREFVESWCDRIGRSAPDLWLRGTASYCIAGHLARRFQIVGDDAASLVRDLAVDNQVRDVYPAVEDMPEEMESWINPRPEGWVTDDAERLARTSELERQLVGRRIQRARYEMSMSSPSKTLLETRGQGGVGCH